MQEHERRSIPIERSGEQADTETLGVTRRAFLHGGALAGGAAAMAPWASSAQNIDQNIDQSSNQNSEASTPASFRDHDGDIAGASIERLQSLMTSGELSSRELVDIYLKRIRAIDKGLDLRTVLQLNPDARRIAAQLDHERRSRAPGTPAWHSDSV